MIKINDLTIRYEDSPAVDAVSLHFDEGKICGIIGPNGAGKSTLLKACVGIINEFGGAIVFDGQDAGKNRRRLRERIGYAPEDVTLMPYLSGREFLQLIADLRQPRNPGQEIERYLKMLGLEGVQDQLIINYSHGMRQKLSVVAALLGQPQYIFLDEALNGLDSLALYHLKNHLTELAEDKKHIVISSHVIQLVMQWCDPITLMHEGKIIRNYSQNDIAALEKKQNKTFEQIYVDMITSLANL
ncbi:MAG TPA: ABC transporter ATP-binding protein [Caldithrix abyssi]|uniref:ABC transporter ATP-binding protein n=1 Tax=Caldithrix abyssi TaxID=187145 RepID=A0A7V4WUE9_CALAY|nr:ABC transporter ATP-binding protein [Caldithrix abyssi]